MSDSHVRRAAKGVLIKRLGRLPTTSEVRDYLERQRGETGGPTEVVPAAVGQTSASGGPPGAPSRAEIREVQARLPAERMEGPGRVRGPSGERPAHTRRTGVGFMRWSEPCRCEIGRDH